MAIKDLGAFDRLLHVLTRSEDDGCHNLFTYVTAPRVEIVWTPRKPPTNLVLQVPLPTSVDSVNVD